jgi:SAM-dependent methyltransferase
MDADLFGPLHAGWYDRWHRGKEYRAEVDQLRSAFARHGPVHSLLDLGCGTARHLELLADAGYEVVGVDRSAGMLAAARERLARFGPRAAVVEGDLLTVRLDRTFDAATMMFSVLGYLTTTERILAALATVRHHLRPGGLLLFDTLDGATILRDGASGGVTEVRDGAHQLLRATTGVLHAEEQIYEMVMRLWHLHGDRILDHTEESHRMRFFLPRELELLLETAGFRLLGTAPLAGERPGPVRQWLRLAWATRTP